ncbi:MAG: ATP-dependent helicase [Thermoplasmatales archaeon]
MEYNLEGFLDPIVLEWFKSKYNEFTAAQKIGIPLIHERKNVLISSPTGTGKTLSGFLVIINELFLLAKQNKLQDKIYCIYISPLKALANDIHRNLEVPLAEIRELAAKKGVNIPRIRVGVRSGDTSQYVRQKMNRIPPHIFITTPESLALSLFSPKFKERFRDVEFIIIDEIHDLASNKRGELLSLLVEFLQYNCRNVTRIGLSATTEPIEEIGKYLIGDDEKGEVHIVEAESNKNLDMRVICPVSDLFSAPQEQVNERTYDIVENLVREHKTTLVFTNTRSGAERVSSKLIERGILDLEAHHSSLSKESRLGVEERLKRGELKCAVSSTSLELGIDIGSIDLVIQVGSPKGIAKGLQRVGRSGHSVFATAKGRIIPMDIDDLIESLVLVKAAREKRLDRIKIPKNSLDVLSQFITGISLDRKWNDREVLDIVRRSYCYRKLDETDFFKVLDYLSGGFEEGNVYAKIWWDRDGHTFGRKKSTRLIYFTNAGTIPEEADYDVFSVDNRHLGSLSEKFVEKLHRGDIFVLGARTYEFMRMRGNKIFIKDASGRKPTVPSWVGEMLPRTFDLSLEVGKFRGELAKRVKEGTVEEFLREQYQADDNSIRSISSYVESQMNFGIPTDNLLLIEGYIDKANQFSVIFHFPYGRRVNDALSRVIAFNISRKFSANSRISLTDDGFMLTFNRRIDISGIVEMIPEIDIKNSLRNAVKSTELFKQRFRHCATRSFMVLRRYRGREVSVARQQLRSEKVLDILFSMDRFPIIEETFREIEDIVMDIDNSEKILLGIREGVIKLQTREYSRYPSPFAFGIISTGISDVVLMEDKTAIIRELQESLLTKMGLEGSSEIDIESLISYQESKLNVNTDTELLEFLKNAGFSDLFSTASFSPMKKAENKDHYLSTVEKLIEEGKIVPVFTGKTTYALPENLGYIASVFRQSSSADLKFDDGDTTNIVARNNSLDPADALIELRKMERSYSAYFLKSGTKIRWYHRNVGDEDYVESVKKVILWFLWQNGPLTYNEIVDRIGEIHEIDEVLESLLEKKIIASGRFYPKREKQYILMEDLRKLRSIDEGEIGRIRMNRSFEKREENYFDQFLFAVNENALRVRGFPEEQAHEDHIVSGSFSRNVRSFFDEKLVPSLIPLNRTEELTHEESMILKSIEEGKVTRDDVEQKTLDKLFRNMYVVSRKGKLKVIRDEPRQPEEMLEAFIGAYGPLSIEDLVSFFGISVSSHLGKLRVKKIVSGHVTYLFSDMSSHPETAIVDREDPVFLVNRARIEGEIGEGMTYFLIEDGSVKLGVETGRENGILEIFDITGEYSGNFEQVMKVVGQISEVEKFDSLIIRRVPFPLPGDAKLREMGYVSVRNFLLKGSYVEDLSFDEEYLLSYLLAKHHLVTGFRHHDPVEALSSILGYRGNFELMMKSDRSIDLEKLVMSKLAVQGYLIDGSPGYLSLDNISLISDLKRHSLSENARKLYEIAKKFQTFSKETLIEKSCFTINQTLNYVNEMIRKCVIYKDSKGKLQITPNSPGRETALNALTRELGIFNGRILFALLNGDVSIDYISDYLAMMVSDGKFKRILPLESRDEMMYAWQDEVFEPVKPNEDIILFPRTLATQHISMIFGWKTQGRLVFLKDGVDPIFFKAKRTGSRVKIATELREDTKKRITRYLQSLNIKVEREENDEVTEKWYEQMIPKKHK